MKSSCTKARVRAHLIRKLLLLERLDLTTAELGRKLEAVQIDPVNLLARNHELVLHNRLRDCRAGQTEYFGTEGLFEYMAGNRALIPMPDLPIFVPFMRRREKELEKYLRQPRGPAVRVLREMEKRGPLTSRSIDCGKKISGYWDADGVSKTKETTQALRFLWEAGRVTVIGRQGLENVYDLSERALPSGLLREGERIELPEAERLLRGKFYRAFHVFDAQAGFFGWQRMSAADRMRAVEEDCSRGLIEPLRVEGVKRMYWALAGTGDALAELREREESTQVRFLPPLDNLLWRRERLEDLFDFSYRWEIYTPAHKRTGGPYTMPILHGSSLVGRLDAHADRDSSTLVLDRIAYEPDFTPTRAMKAALEKELDRLRAFCGLEGIVRSRNRWKISPLSGMFS